MNYYEFGKFTRTNIDYETSAILKKNYQNGSSE